MITCSFQQSITISLFIFIELQYRLPNNIMNMIIIILEIIIIKDHGNNENKNHQILH